jgi:hypothetical protein
MLRESLLDPNVELVQTVGRTATEAPHRKLREIVHSDLWHYETIEASLSGAGAASSERGPIMWARIKGKTENALLKMPFSAYIFRPGMIQALDGIQSKTKSSRVFYKIGKPLLPLLRRTFLITC